MNNHVLPACYHCGEPAVAGYSQVVQGVERPFCCQGCGAVAQLISGAGLDNYYQTRTETASKIEETQALDFASFDVPEFQQRHLVLQGDTASVYLQINGMHCAACVWLIEQHLSSLEGVVSCNVNLSTGMAKLVWQPNTRRLSTLVQSIHQLGYTATLAQTDHSNTKQRQQAYFRLGVAAFGMMQVGMFSFALYAGAWQGMAAPMQHLMRMAAAVVATAVVLLAATPFFSSAWRAILRGKVVMDLPIAVAIGLAYSTSLWATATHSGEVYFDSVAMFTFFLLLARHIEQRLKQQLSRQQQTGVVPQSVLATRNGGCFEQAKKSVPESLQIGDTVWLMAGQTLPVDGTIENAHAVLDESILTGESTLVNKNCGDTAYAGAINGEQQLQLSVTAVGSHTHLAALQRLQFEALQDRPVWQSVADHIAPYFIVAVLALASVSFLTWHIIAPEHALWVALAVLVVSCPCALSLATPTVYTAVLSKLAACGVIVYKSSVIERFAKVTDVVFDKTGTLTSGQPAIIAHYAVGDLSKTQTLRVAASLEQGVNHPLATALITAAASCSIQLISKQTIVNGQGVEAFIGRERYRLGSAAFCEVGAMRVDERLASHVYLAVERAGTWQTEALFCIDDALREDAAAAVSTLQQRGCNVHIASGDRPQVVSAVAKKLAVDSYQGNCSATAKLEWIKRLQQSGAVVATVGDGLNDLPLLGGADVSIAVSNASDLTKSNVDVLLHSTKLLNLVTAFDSSQCAVKRIKQNIAWAITYNIVMVPLAATALLAPWLAALGMSFSSLLVVINAKRV